MQEERAKLKQQKVRFDTIGLSLLVLMLVSWEILLSKGQEWDWFGDPFGRIQTLVVLCVGGLSVLVWWETRQSKPVVELSAAEGTQLSRFLAWSSSVPTPCSTGRARCCLAFWKTSLATTRSTPGWCSLPSGIFTILAIIVAGRLLGLGADARWLIAGGLLVLLAAGSWWMSRLNLDISPGQVIWPRVVLVLGLGIIFAPLNVAAYLYIPRELRGAAVGLFALLRNEGGSFGTSVGQTLTERREQFHSPASQRGPRRL